MCMYIIQPGYEIITLFRYLYVIINEQQYNGIYYMLYNNYFIDIILILYNLNYGSNIGLYSSCREALYSRASSYRA